MTCHLKDAFNDDSIPSSVLVDHGQRLFLFFSCPGADRMPPSAFRRLSTETTETHQQILARPAVTRSSAFCNGTCYFLAFSFCKLFPDFKPTIQSLSPYKRPLFASLLKAEDVVCPSETVCCFTYRQLFCPMMDYESLLWRSAACSHSWKIKALQSNFLLIAPWCVVNKQIYDDLGTPFFANASEHCHSCEPKLADARKHLGR
jgi:hypothetical protein